MARPTISTIKSRLLGNIRGALGLVAQARRTLVGVFSDAVAAQLYLLYSYADNLFAESHPLDATGSRLDQWGEVLAISRNPASFARLEVQIMGIIGTSLPVSSEFQVAATGQFYITESEVMIGADGNASVNIRSRALGTNQNLEVGDKLNLTTAVSGIQNEASVTEVLTSATNAEGDEEYRDRIVQHFRRSTWRAGGIDDYIAWALADQNVRYAWVAKNVSGIANRVGIFVLKENDVFLSDGEITTVQNYINARAPVTADPIVRSPTTEAVAFTIQIRENNSTTQTSVRNNLRDLFARARSPRGTINSDGSVNTGRVLISQIREAVSQAAGEEDNVVEIPTSNILPEALYGILTVGEITFKDLA